MKTLGIKVDDEFHKKMKIRTIELNCSIKDYIIHLIKKDLQKKKSKYRPLKQCIYSQSNPERILSEL